MILDTLFNHNKTYSCLIYTLSQTYTNGVIGPEVWTLSKTVECLYWKTSQNDAFVSSQFRDIVSSVVIVRPEDFTSNITTDSKIEIKDGSTLVDTMSTIYADNIGGQNKVIAIQCQEFKK